MAYRYKRRKYKNRSKIIKMTFQSFVDISTEADTMKIISINAGGPDVLKRLSPFFSAYKYYRLGAVKATFVPASTLPVDPLQLSYSEDDLDMVDPRDQLTPGMIRITNGEDILEDIAGLTGDQQRDLYNNMLLDPRWYKWMLQSGCKRYASPRYWQIGQLHQDKWPGAVTNMPVLNSDGSAQVIRTDAERLAGKSGSANVRVNTVGSSPYGIFQTGHRGKLGWLPTDGLQTVFKGGNDGFQQPFIAAIPTIELMKVLMPPVRKTNYFYRVFITESCYFKDPIVMNVNGMRPLDVFHTHELDTPRMPQYSFSWATDQVVDLRTGGNDGSS